MRHAADETLTIDDVIADQSGSAAKAQTPVRVLDRRRGWTARSCWTPPNLQRRTALDAGILVLATASAAGSGRSALPLVEETLAIAMRALTAGSPNTFGRPIVGFFVGSASSCPILAG